MRRRLSTFFMVLCVAMIGFFAGRAQSNSSCSSDSDCAGFGRCSSGKCGSCSSDSDCRGGRCSSGRCSNAP